MHTTLIVLRFIHIVSGVFWAGTGLFLAIFLLPAIRALGPDGGKVAQYLVGKRKMPVYLGIVAGLTILSGLLLYWRDSSGTNGAFMRSRPGMTYALGAVAAIVAASMTGRNGAIAKRLGALGEGVRASGGPPSPEQSATMSNLQNKLVFNAQVGATMAFIAIASMAVARYL